MKKSWTDRPIDMRVWKRVRGNPFADYNPREGIALWSLWEMPSCAVGRLVRRGRRTREPSVTRKIRLPASEWKRLEKEALRTGASVDTLVATRLRRAS